MVDVEWGMKRLDQIYQSEDHLKLSLASELAQMYGSERIRLEWNPSPGTRVDIGVRREEVTIPIELKYKTDEASITDPAFAKEFDLKSHGDHQGNHYAVLDDVNQIEDIVDEQGRYGYVVLLTNDSNYWTEPSSESASYDEFRLHEGRIVGGTLDWRGETSDWMERMGIEDPIHLDGEYRIEWNDFNFRDDIEVTNHSEFRFLTIRVP